MKWTDTTSYMRDEIKPEKGGKLTPRVWSADIGPYLRAVVVKAHREYPGEWVMHLHPLFTDRRLDLPDVATAEAAQERALIIVRDVLAEAAQGL